MKNPWWHQIQDLRQISLKLSFLLFETLRERVLRASFFHDLCVNPKIKTIDLTLIAVIPILVFLPFSYRVIAEDPGLCFMITSSGRMVRLGKLCGVTNTPPPKNHSQIFRVPIKRRLGRTPVIDVTFNDYKTFEMVVDTGAHSTLITSKMANILQLQTTGIMQAQIADGSQVKFLTVKVDSLAVGGVVANNLEVAIAPKAGVGLLGHDFFGNYDIKIREKDVEFYSR
ncbi:retropepsin-like aspartic protease [Nodularia sp. UHCC 0506]|uniref:retropepsin-like aspartic protease family protein n=1 Tax=Nodularia sp. UHCC 0506 TaxID=3110243 RepID=UPI002B21FB56|nr:retropepsin-like aspartic protease [Nodularia sp. UHCC 0506]MEA5517213.1 retropepsin-like aspartic protease [Nodularia sp. UHCC 0506]